MFGPPSGKAQLDAVVSLAGTSFLQSYPYSISRSFARAPVLACFSFRKRFWAKQRLILEQTNSIRIDEYSRDWHTCKYHPGARRNRQMCRPRRATRRSAKHQLV